MALRVMKADRRGNSMYSDEFQLGDAQLELEVYIQDKEQTKNK